MRWALGQSPTVSGLLVDCLADVILTRYRRRCADLQETHILLPNVPSCDLSGQSSSCSVQIPCSRWPVWSHQEASSEGPSLFISRRQTRRGRRGHRGRTQGGQSTSFLGIVRTIHRAHSKLRLSLTNENNTASSQCPQELFKTGKKTVSRQFLTVLPNLFPSFSFLK